MIAINIIISQQKQQLVLCYIKIKKKAKTKDFVISKFILGKCESYCYNEIFTSHLMVLQAGQLF
jgi:hypothetical protein